MTDAISSITQSSASAANSSNSSSKATATMLKEDFLTLLVAQLQNQDPLNPDDPTEFTSQLTQFSSLEQLFNLNDSMNNMATANANAARFSTLNTIGKDVSFPTSSFQYNGGPTEIGYLLDGQAKDVTLSLQANGVTVATLKGTELNSGSHFITWDGLTTDGKEAPVGTYKIIVEAKAADGQGVSVQSLVKSEVTGVDLTGNYGGTLITAAGPVSFTSILGVHDRNSAQSASPAAGTANDIVNEVAEAAEGALAAATGE